MYTYLLYIVFKTMSRLVLTMMKEQEYKRNGMCDNYEDKTKVKSENVCFKSAIFSWHIFGSMRRQELILLWKEKGKIWC